MHAWRTRASTSNASPRCELVSTIAQLSHRQATHRTDKRQCLCTDTRKCLRTDPRQRLRLRHALAAVEDGNRAHGLGSAIFECVELALMACAVAGSCCLGAWTCLHLGDR